MLEKKPLTPFSNDIAWNIVVNYSKRKEIYLDKSISRTSNYDILFVPFVKLKSKIFDFMILSIYNVFYSLTI